MALGFVSGVADAGISFGTGRRAVELATQAALAAVADAGLSIDAIDGLCVAKGADLGPSDRPAVELADYLGISVDFCDTTLVGGVSPIVQLGHALRAIASGQCSRVLVVYASVQATLRQRKIGGSTRPAHDHVAPFERAAGLPYPIGPNALAAARHSYEFGTTPDHLAAVAVSDRTWATHNPTALVREPLTAHDVETSPMISAPLRKIDCCLITDGAGALVVEGTARTSRAVPVLGFAEHHRQYSVLSVSDLTSTGAAVTGPRAMEMAGIGTADVGVVELYDAFSILPLVLLEDLGFVERGMSGPFVAEGNTLPGGVLPMNTQGGGLSYCHPGIFGIFLVIEAVRQLRGEALGWQVPDPRVALCQGAGGGAFGGSQATLILEAAA